MSISFEAPLTEIEAQQIVKIPISASKQLPSRGMVMVQGTINGLPFISPLEPDGKESHWFQLSDILLMDLGVTVGQTMSFNIEPMSEWVEPEIPDDIMDAIIQEGLLNQWNTLTAKARWEWLRWIRSTKNEATRRKRIEVACSKLQKGDRRPCCFDTTRCTIMEVSTSGVLKDLT
jgi:hypothetical protein